jgi:hypothetical protein
MGLIARAEAVAVLNRRFDYWNKSGAWGKPFNCGYADDGTNEDWVIDTDMKVMRAQWESKTAKGYIYRTTLSSSSFTVDFLCHTKNPSDGTSFNFHLKQKAT